MIILVGGGGGGGDISYLQPCYQSRGIYLPAIVLLFHVGEGSTSDQEGAPQVYSMD